MSDKQLYQDVVDLLNQGRFSDEFRKKHLDIISELQGKTVEKLIPERIKRTVSLSNRILTGDRMRKLWSDEDWVRWRLRKVEPNGCELVLNQLLQEIFSGEYGLNTRAEIMVLGGKVPDFVNIKEQKKVIELFGTPWHKVEDEEDRIFYFKQFGWDTLIVWVRELRNLKKLSDRILKFHGSTLVPFLPPEYLSRYRRPQDYFDLLRPNN